MTPIDHTETDTEAAEDLREAMHQAFAAAALTDDERYVVCGLSGVKPFKEPQSEAELAATLRAAPRRVKDLFKSAQQKLLQSPEAAKILHGYLIPNNPPA